MILGVGIDLVEISRIRGLLDRHGERFTARIFHVSELEQFRYELDAPAAAAYVAARFAAKEAAVKALGAGFTRGIGPRDLRVASLPSGQPVLSFHDKAQDRAREMGVRGIHLSLTHSRDAAGAVVVLESW
jgi:holo-[acyl-carrier protein] synthase